MTVIDQCVSFIVEAVAIGQELRQVKERLQNWKSYEEVAKYLLNQFTSHFGLVRIEGKQRIIGVKSGTEYEIDAKGIREGAHGGFVVVECRRYTTPRQNQEKLGSLAYRIIDTGAIGGIMVSPLGLQDGAAKIAASENIIDVQLNADCTPEEFTMKFLNKLMMGVKDGVVLGESAVIEVSRSCKKCGRMFKSSNDENICSDCSQ